MESITRKVRDLSTEERRAMESAVGHALSENQQVILQVVTLDVTSTDDVGAQQDDGLPGWTNVYEGLSDDEIAELEEVILNRANLTRSID